MRLPWTKKLETRQQSSYTDTLISYLVNRASGSIADSASTAAVEAAAGAHCPGHSQAPKSRGQPGYSAPLIQPSWDRSDVTLFDGAIACM